MIGADVVILLFGAGLLGLTWLVGREAIRSAEASRRNRAFAAGALAVVFGLAAMLAVLEGLARLFLR